MKILSPERMARYDEYAIRKWGIPSAVLMENAGRNTYRLMKERYLGGNEPITVVCGRGNNGGDGFVIARYALMDGFRVSVYLVAEKKDLYGDAALNMELFASLGGEIIECVNKPSAVRKGAEEAQIIVDALFGTGLSKPVEGAHKAVIDEINHSGKPVIAVDIPSGIDGRTGTALGAAVRAVHTFTYAYPKIGQVLFPGAHHTGKITVIDISIPPFIEKKIGFDGHIIDGAMLRGFLKRRLPWSHKGTFGHTLVIAGSPGKTGAAHMASLAALKAGAGLVTLVVPVTLNPVMEVKTTEVMTHPVKDDGEGFFTIESFDEIASLAEDKDVIVMGPGLSQKGETMELARRIYGTVEKPFVIDADGINAFRGHMGLFKKVKRNAVLTPHPGELAGLIGKTPVDVNSDRMGTASSFVGKYGVNLLLKGARSVFFTTGKEIFINPTGNPSLAKGGSGDILTGFIGGFASQGYSLVEATILGTYLHGYMADLWVDSNSETDLLALDLLKGLGKAIEDIRDGTDRIYIERSL